jgi:AAHS family 3-hydroxyphenylpropionic acid transporter
MPNIIAVVAETVRAKRATFAVSAMAAGLSLGGVFVAQLARFQPPGSGWHILFLIGGMLPLLLLPLLWWGLPETRAAHETADAPRTGVLRALFGNGQAAATIALWVVFALTLLQLSLLLNWLPSLVIAKGFAREQGFLAATVFNLGGIAGSLAIGALCDRFGARGPMSLVFALMAASFWAMAAAATFNLLLVAGFVAGFTVLGAQFALYGLSPRIYPDETRGTGVGAAVAVGRIGAITGPILAGILLGSGATASQLMLWMIPLVLVAGISMAALSHAAGRHLAKII